MYTITWDTNPKNAVYAEFSDENIKECKYNKSLPVFVCVDWGWTHPMACGVFQYDKRKDEVYMIDEMIKSKVKLEELAVWIKKLPYTVQGYICDIAGNQEREQTGMSNIKWFKQNVGINFRFKRSGIIEGISAVRSYVKSATGKVRFFIDPKCKESIEGMKRYSYKEKDGKIENENPIKQDDDAVDMIRYYFMYYHDPKLKNQQPIQIGHYR
jgi:hypothetical protein